MPIMRNKEIRSMSSEERTKKLGELRTELLRLKTMIRAGGTVENPARFKELRRTIARILTIDNEQKPTSPRQEPRPEKKEKKKK